LSLWQNREGTKRFSAAVDEIPQQGRKAKPKKKVDHSNRNSLGRLDPSEDILFLQSLESFVVRVTPGKSEVQRIAHLLRGMDCFLTLL
jgi:hypothetical protein